MELLINLLSWRQILGTIAAYVVSTVVYRLFFHPLAGFPGPKLAAITRYYEGYYDVYRNGHYTFKIAELHRQYGPIVRISPYELHVSDPAFYDIIYRQDGVWDKHDWAVNAFAAYGATLFTHDHHVHKARRQPLNSFFSKAKVWAYEDHIRFQVERVCARFDTFAATKAVFDLGAAVVAVARDVANEYILGKHLDSIGAEDFDAALVAGSQGGGTMWRTSKFVRWLAPVLQSIPPEWMVKMADPVMAQFFRFMVLTREDTRRLMKAVDSGEDGPNTIVHEIMKSKLPASEKTFGRIFEDVSTISGAGFETTASALRLILFHVYTNPDILRRLREEIASAEGADKGQTPRLKTLEQLPYLTAALMEGLRLSPAIATRMARVAPDRDIVYDKWKIPAGTPVGMTTILFHTDETMYPEPHRFDPDRWMDPNPWTAGQQSGRLFAPFAKGSRNCLGMHLAWAEMYLVVAILLQRYDIEFHDITARDFQAESDQFAIGTRSRGIVHASVKKYER